MNTLYHYATMQVADVDALTRFPVPEDSFLAHDKTSSALKELLEKGYRWIRTDGDIAVFEKQIRR